jgi:hypothetical protein
LRVILPRVQLFALRLVTFSYEEELTTASSLVELFGFTMVLVKFIGRQD